MRARLRSEEGQILPLFMVGLLSLLLIAAGVVLDFGHAYLMQRKLQAAADAAAIAGADALPNAASAQAAAAQWGAGVGAHNTVDGATQDPATAWCLTGVSYCYGNKPGGPATNGQGNGLVVKEHVAVPTTFLKLVGIDTINVSATSTACGMCGSQPLNIVLVLDRTGSMDGNMETLRTAVQTFLEGLDPSLDSVSLLVLPPIPNGDTVCDPAPFGLPIPFSNDFSYPMGSDSRYLAVPWSTDYLTNGQINTSSALGAAVTGSCLKASGYTAYKQALVAAQAQLASPPPGRAKAQGVIVFESDGAANTAPESFYSTAKGSSQTVDGYTLYKPASGHELDVLQPCQSAVRYSQNTIQPAGTFVYTVYFNDTNDNTCRQAAHAAFTYQGVNYPLGSEDAEGISTTAALQQMASAPNDAFTAEQGSAELTQSFAAIANKIQASSLVPDAEAQG